LSSFWFVINQKLTTKEISIYEIKITSKCVAQKFELKWSLDGPLSKLCVTPPFSINFRCQIENQVSDYRHLGASSLVNLSSFWFVIKQKLTTKEISIFSNSSHFEWTAGLLDTILKGDHSRTIPAKFALIWFSGFRGENLNVIFYQNISNLYNRYTSVERNISQKNAEDMLNYSLSCSCS
jgi:hypothetical protein